MGLTAVALASTLLATGFTPFGADDTRGSSTTAPAAAPVAAKIRVQVLGQVKNPGNVELAAGARLSNALIKAGAYSAETVAERPIAAVLAEVTCESGGADLRYVYLTRAVAADSSKPGMSYQIDVGRARQQHDLRYDPLLQQNDKIYVPECRPPLRPVRVPPIAPTYTR